MSSKKTVAARNKMTARDKRIDRNGRLVLKCYLALIIIFAIISLIMKAMVVQAAPVIEKKADIVYNVPEVIYINSEITTPVVEPTQAADFEDEELKADEMSNNEEETETNEFALRVQGITPIVRTLNTTAYCPCKRCCNKTDGVTASGTIAQPWHTVASGRKYPYGTIIYIPELSDWPNGGWFEVEDRGVSNGHLDIFFTSHSVANDYGRRHLESYVYLPR